MDHKPLADLQSEEAGAGPGSVCMTSGEGAGQWDRPQSEEMSLSEPQIYPNYFSSTKVSEKMLIKLGSGGIHP